MKNDYDVIVIGGGVNGAGIARDCALRGIKALLIEKHDFARGASGNNTGMIHGGIRYMRYDVATTKSSCTDSGYIQKIAPHLLFRVPFIFPVLKSDKNAKWLLEAAEIFFEAYDTFQPLKRGKSHTRLTRDEVYQLEPGLCDEVIGAVSLDEWGIDSYRLTLGNALDAKEHGADVLTYCEVTNFLRDNQKNIAGVVAQNTSDGKVASYQAPIVVNATGAWGPQLAKKTGIEYRLRHGKGVHVVFSHRVSNIGILINAIDGRQIFFLPHENNTIIGTTDDDFYGSLDEPPILQDEVEYILEAARHYFPKIDLYRKSYTYVGVRPTIYEWGKNEDVLSREHVICDHGVDGAAGLFSITGGKLASYRMLAEEMTDIIAKRIGNTKPCTTHEQPLPGGAGFDNRVSAETTSSLFSQLAVSRLTYRHGSRAKEILASDEKEPRYSQDVCICEPVTEAEIRYCAKNEMVCHLDDMRGRTHLALGACGGVHCMLKASQIVADEKQWSCKTQMTELRHLMSRNRRARRAVLLGPNLASEELNHLTHFLAANLRAWMQAASEPMREP